MVGLTIDGIIKHSDGEESPRISLSFDEKGIVTESIEGTEVSESYQYKEFKADVSSLAVRLYKPNGVLLGNGFEFSFDELLLIFDSATQGSGIYNDYA